MALLMLDIDHFKRVNDRYGHVAGDEVLREVAAVIRESTRSEDLVARYGGEEFVIALPVSVQDRAIERAEIIRCELAERRIIARNDELQVTASVGLSFAPPGRLRNVSALLLSADQALYEAKSRGATVSSPLRFSSKRQLEKPIRSSSSPLRERIFSAWFKIIDTAGDKSRVAGVELAIAGEPPARRPQNWRVALGS